MQCTHDVIECPIHQINGWLFLFRAGEFHWEIHLTKPQLVFIRTTSDWASYSPEVGSTVNLERSIYIGFRRCPDVAVICTSLRHHLAITARIVIPHSVISIGFLAIVHARILARRTNSFACVDRWLMSNTIRTRLNMRCSASFLRPRNSFKIKMLMI